MSQGSAERKSKANDPNFVDSRGYRGCCSFSVSADTTVFQVLDLDPSPLNPMGVKGAGEVGIVATGAALSNAVSNALGVQVTELPLSPTKQKEIMGENLKP